MFSQDADLIEILWKQDIDLGLSKEFYGGQSNPEALEKSLPENDYMVHSVYAMANRFMHIIILINNFCMSIELEESVRDHLRIEENQRYMEWS